MSLSCLGGATLLLVVVFCSPRSEPPTYHAASQPTSQPGRAHEPIVLTYAGIEADGSAQHPWTLYDRAGTPEFKTSEIESVGAVLYMRSDVRPQC